MDLNNKLKGLPHVYYFNLDNRVDRKEYMESQFDYWKISNYDRVSGTKYLASQKEQWINLILGDIYFFGMMPQVTANAMTHIEFLNTWLKTTSDPYLILMEDDYDLNLIEYWHFDWEYLMKKIPYDWDCIQLGYESWNHVRFFLHPKDDTSGFGPILINRHFAQKLINLHFINGKYSLIRKYGPQPVNKGYRIVSLDSFVCFLGKTYQLPLITQNPHLDKVPKRHHFICRDLYYNWWQNKRDCFSLEEFFSYGKNNDSEMTIKVDH